MMSKHETKHLLLIPIAACFLFFGTSAAAQVTGDLVEPDVLLLVDSSLSMDWRDNQDPSGQLDNWYWAKEACEADLSTSDGKTAWQKVLDAFLGEMDGSTYRCSVEPPPVRPGLHALDPANANDFLADMDGDGVPDNISEYREETYHSTFRAVNCPENASNPGEPFWIQNPLGHYQCIDPDESGSIVTLSTGFFCMSSDVVTVDGTEHCLNLHPGATARQANGILDRYENVARFGFMAYDQKPICGTADCTDHDKRWDYGVCRDWVMEEDSGEHMTHQWNAGARGDFINAVGGMVRIRSNLQQANQEVRDALESIEPLFCSPTGALLDDAGYYFTASQEVLPRTTTITGEDTYYRCRPKIVVLISDGQPTQDFEFGAGMCNGTEADWKPTVENTDTNCVTGTLDGYVPPVTTRNCPWRSSAEEAAELYDVGQDIIAKLDPSSADMDPRPVLLVVIGFNVPDIDCAVNPEKCYAYNSEYSANRLCWGGADKIPECLPDADAGVGEETVCLMNPRQYLNEVACQGWPYLPSVVFQGHEEATFPPWHPDADNAICATETDYNAASDICIEGERALFVSNTEKFTTALSLVLNDVTAATTTRTDLVTHNVFNLAVGNDVPAQYEFRTGYTKNQVDPWEGVLTRVDVGCDNQILADHDVATSLASQNGRKFYSMTVPSETAVLDNNAYNDLSPTTFNAWIGQTPSGFSTSTLESTDFDDCDLGISAEIGGASCQDDQVKTKLVEFLKGRGLADIYNSTPDVLEPPNALSGSPSYVNYMAENGIGKREPFLFVGTNDGVLHAFDITAMGDSGTNNEKWGYIPRSLLKQVRHHFPMPEIIPSGGSYSLGDDQINGLYQQMILFDGSPIARDVLMARDLDKLGEDETVNPWRAVVFGGVGKGARTYYALDVTETTKSPETNGPDILWEISPGENLYGNNDNTMQDNIDKMGYPVSKPALAYVSNIESTMQAQVAAAILPGGWRSDVDNVNTGVYIVRLGDGKVLKYLEPSFTGDLDAGMCADSVGLAHDGTEFWEFAQLIGEPVVVDGTLANRRARVAFIGDDRGKIWMIDMEEEDPKDWCLRMYFDTLISWHFPYQECWPRHPGETADPYSTCTPDPTQCFHTDCCATDHGDEVVPATKCAANAEYTQNMNGPRAMVLGAPTIAKNDRNEPVLIFGTGQYDELSAWNRNRIFSITDKRDSAGVHTPEINWWIGDYGIKMNSNSFPDITMDSSLGVYEAWLTNIEAEMKNSRIYADSSWNAGPDAPQYLFNVGEKLIGKATIFDQVAYFTTYVPIEDPAGSSDPCLAGTSRIWAINYDAKVCEDSSVQGCEYTSADFQDPEDTPIGEFIESNKHKMFENYPSELLSSVQVIRRPAGCDGGGGEVFELAAQKSSSNSSSSGGSTPSAGPIDIAQKRIDKNPSHTVTKVTFDSWMIVFE